MHRPCFDQRNDGYAATRQQINARSITNVSGFWRHLNHIPPPGSRLTRNTAGRRRKAGRGPPRHLPSDTVEGWGLFVDGVCPDWEDPTNSRGGTLTMKSDMTPTEADAVWESLAVLLVSEQLPWAERIVGARIVDRISSYRVEVWTNDGGLDFMAEALADMRGRLFCGSRFTPDVLSEEEELHGSVRRVESFYSIHATGESYPKADGCVRARRRNPTPSGGGRGWSVKNRESR